ncbi:MAG: hypothetical protein HQK51_09300 [Oligoflexia bacterium]|nr:hypothetical protein [Oligoflexia bacterium]
MKRSNFKNMHVIRIIFCFIFLASASTIWAAEESKLSKESATTEKQKVESLPTLVESLSSLSQKASPPSCPTMKRIDILVVDVGNKEIYTDYGANIDTTTSEIAEKAFIKFKDKVRGKIKPEALKYLEGQSPRLSYKSELLKSDVTFRSLVVAEESSITVKLQFGKEMWNPHAVPKEYDKEVFDILCMKHIKNIRTLAKEDNSKIVFVGIASANTSGYDEQQFPEHLRKLVNDKQNPRPITIMLIDNAFVEPRFDFKQIYGKDTFGAKATNWEHKQPDQASGKIRTFVNTKDFAAKVTIRVYSTVVTPLEFYGESGTLCGNIPYGSIATQLQQDNVDFVAGNFYGGLNFIDTTKKWYPSLEELKSQVDSRRK